MLIPTVNYLQIINCKYDVTKKYKDYRKCYWSSKRKFIAYLYANIATIINIQRWQIVLVLMSLLHMLYNALLLKKQEYYWIAPADIKLYISYMLICLKLLRILVKNLLCHFLPLSDCDGRPNHNRGWILASTHSPAFHGCIPTPNTVVLMVDALLNVKFLLVREYQIGQHAIFHEVQKVSTSFDPHSFMRGCELMALLHLVEEGLETLLKNAAHQSLADCSLCVQFGRRTKGIYPQIFPRVFKHSLGSNCSISALARSTGCLVCLPELLDHFQTVSRRIWSYSDLFYGGLRLFLGS